MRNVTCGSEGICGKSKRGSYWGKVGTNKSEIKYDQNVTHK